MISYAKGDLIKNVTSGVIMHQTNCHGVMGAGFALQLKHTYPINYQHYTRYCAACKDDPRRLLGEALIVKEGDVTIINAFGQVGTGGRKPTSYDALDDIFYKLYHSEVNINQSWNDHIHLPLLGCGLGGGVWIVVEEIILSHLPVNKEITVWTL